MAQASFIIRAIDKTREAFISVRAGLRNVTGATDVTQKKLFGLGLKMTGLATIALAMKGSFNRLSSDIENVKGLDPEVAESFQSLSMMAATAQGVLDQIVAQSVHGYENLYRIIRYKVIEAYSGLAAAEADATEHERELLNNHRTLTGYYDKEAAALHKLGEAQKNFRLVRETPGASVARRREEATMLETQALNTEDMVKKTGLLTQATDLRTEAEKELIALQKDFNESQSVRIAGEDDISRVWQTSTKSLRELNAEREKTRRLTETSNLNMLGGDPNAMEKSIVLNKKLTEIDKDRLRIMRKNKDLAHEAGSIIASSFEEAVIAGGKLSEVLRGLGQDLMRLIFRNLITEPLAAGISGGLRSIFRASGGPVSSGSNYLVGENGPELFTPSQAGRIIPNHQVGQGGGGGGTYYIDATGADRAGMSRLEMMIKSLNGSIEHRAIAAVSNRRARGGSSAALA